MVGRDLIELAGHLKPAPHITIVTRLSPADGETGEDEQKHGELALEGVVALRIGADVKVIFCQPVGSKTASNLPAHLNPQPDYCGDFVPEDLKFTPADNPAEVRSGRLTTRLYIGSSNEGGDGRTESRPEAR